MKDKAIVSTSVVTDKVNREQNVFDDKLNQKTFVAMKQNGNEVVFLLKIIWHFMACKSLATNKDFYRWLMKLGDKLNIIMILFNL